MGNKGEIFLELNLSPGDFMDLGLSFLSTVCKWLATALCQNVILTFQSSLQYFLGALPSNDVLTLFSF